MCRVVRLVQGLERPASGAAAVVPLFQEGGGLSTLARVVTTL